MTVDTTSVDRLRIGLPRNSLVVLVGPAGCGKSTFAARHFRPTEIVSSDECRGLISDDPGNQSVSRHAFELMHFIIEKRLLLARLTVCDATNLEAAARRPLVDMAKYFGSFVVAIVFQIPLEVCMLRNSDRRRVVPDDTLRNQYAMFEKAKKAIDREGFDRVFILDQHGQSDAILEVSRTTTRRRRK